MHILPETSRSKRNQKMKLGQLIEYNKINIFIQKKCTNEAGRLVPLFKKMLNMRRKQVICSLVSMYFDSPQPRIQ